ncbi:MAG TPA: TetR/AcrR family transcriptional regulator [Magnetospirillaceae bacterium]|nr:TetR/AcrR family transcriptional regulator [Magnetospirillaceae bacterium]
MRYGSEHKQETRRKILDIAGKRFRREGVEAVGVASLMADCGLTHGGFYAHFKSKDELAAAALEQGMRDSSDRIFSHADQSEDKIGAYIRAYLSPAHRDTTENGCAFASLAPELSRGDGPARATVAGNIEPYLDRIGRLLRHSKPATDPASVRRQATALFSLLMGSLQLARLTNDRTLSDSILESGVKAALDLVSVFEGV